MGCCSSPICSERGIWQGSIVAPLLLNILVDCMLRQWHHQTGNNLVGKFHADDGRVAGFEKEIMQEGFDVLLALFARVGLLPDVIETKAMVSTGHPRPDFLSGIAFERCCDHDLPACRARKLAKVQCPHCGHAMSNQCLPTHIRHVHVAVPDVHTELHCASPPLPRKCPRTSDTFPGTLNHCTVNLDTDDTVCPVPQCPAHSPSHFIMRRHFCIRHPTDCFQLRGDINFLQCPHCGFLLTHLTPEHFQSKFCIKQAARCEHLLSSDHCVATADESIPFHIGAEPIEFVSNFWCLGRTLCKDDSDDMAACTRLQKARQVWGCFSQLLQKDGASIETVSRFCRTVIQQTLLCGSATWVLSARALNRLEHFHARCARGIAHRPIRRRADGTWETPHTDEVLRICRLHPLAVCIR